MKLTPELSIETKIRVISHCFGAYFGLLCLIPGKVTKIIFLEE